MNRIVVHLILVLLVFPVRNSEAQTLDQILEKHFSASGQDRLNEISSVKSSGKAVQMGMELPFLQIQKRPNMMYLELDIDGSKLIQAFDGVAGWSDEPWMDPPRRKLEGPELANLEQMAAIDSDLVNWRDKGHSLELVEPETTDHGSYYVLKLTRKEGNIYRYYIDSGTLLIHRMVILTDMGGDMIEGETIMTDYREIDGIVVPFWVEMKFGGRTLMTNIIEEIEFNVQIEDSTFSGHPDR